MPSLMEDVRSMWVIDNRSGKRVYERSRCLWCWKSVVQNQAEAEGGMWMQRERTTCEKSLTFVDGAVISLQMPHLLRPGNSDEHEFR